MNVKHCTVDVVVDRDGLLRELESALVEGGSIRSVRRRIPDIVKRHIVKRRVWDTSKNPRKPDMRLVSGECPGCGTFGESVRAFDWVQSDGLFRPSRYHCSYCDNVWSVGLEAADGGK